jgi:hypothetical protein
MWNFAIAQPATKAAGICFRQSCSYRQFTAPAPGTLLLFSLLHGFQAVASRLPSAPPMPAGLRIFNGRCPGFPSISPSARGFGFLPAPFLAPPLGIMIPAHEQSLRL